MNTYQKQKERVRELAINWQSTFDEQNYSWGELAYFEHIFTK